MDASIHIRYTDLDSVLDALSSEFDADAPADAVTGGFVELFDVFFQNLPTDLDSLSSDAALTAFSEMRSSIDRAARSDARATLLVTDNFVSIYWNDIIRIDSLDDIMIEFSEKCDSPVLGAAVFDGNFVLRAVDNFGAYCDAFLRFGRGESELEAAVDFHSVLEMYDSEPVFSRLLATETAGEIFAALERELGLTFYLDSADCRERGYDLVCEWQRADVFRA